MTISLGNAIKCIKEDEHWVKKILVLGFVFIIMQIATNFLAITAELNVTSVVCAIVAIVTTLWYFGFIFSSINKTANSDKFQMAELNESNLLLVGLKSCFALLGWGILTTVVLVIVGLLYTVIAGIIGGIVFGILGFIIGFENQILSICIIIFSTIAGIIGGLYFAQFINAAFAFYFKRLKFKDLISFRKQLVAISENKHASWTLIGKSILFSLAFVLVIVALTVSIVGILLLPFVIPAAYFVAYNLLVQYSKAIEIEKYLQ